MKKYLLFIVALYSLTSTNIIAQDSLNLFIREIQTDKFQKVKLFINVTDSKGNNIDKLDSTTVFVKEKETGKKVNPSIQKFIDSDEGIAICFTVDASHSMYGAPLNNLKEGLLGIVSDFRPVDKLAIGTFNDEFYKKMGFESDKEVIRYNINDITTGGKSSQIYESAIESINWLKSLSDPKRKILVLLSDGIDNGSKYKLEDVITEAKNSGITVYTIASVKETNENKKYLENMERIATATKDGKFYKINKPEDIKDLIPAIYGRVKNEYILTYYSYAPVNTPINISLEIKSGELIFLTESEYTSPNSIVENAPATSFWETKEFLYGSIIAGLLLIGLTVFLVINIKKKKKYLIESEEEKRLRKEEAESTKLKFSEMTSEYESLLDKLEQQESISSSDKEKIMQLESQMESVGKTISGTSIPIDVKRRTMILEKGEVPKINSLPTLIVKQSGRQYQIAPYGVTLGRKDCNILIDDDTVSRQHAKIYSLDGGYILEDLGSTNGTFVNNSRINQSNLNPGDTIRLGNVEIVFQN